MICRCKGGQQIGNFLIIIISIIKLCGSPRKVCYKKFWLGNNYAAGDACVTCVLASWTFSLPLCAFCSLSFLLCKFNHLTPMKYKSRQWRKNFLPNRQNLSLVDDAIRKAQKLCMPSNKEEEVEWVENWFCTWTRSLHEHINAHDSRILHSHHSLPPHTVCKFPHFVALCALTFLV